METHKQVKLRLTKTSRGKKAMVFNLVCLVHFLPRLVFVKRSFTCFYKKNCGPVDKTRVLLNVARFSLFETVGESDGEPSCTLHYRPGVIKRYLRQQSENRTQKVRMLS